MHVIIFSNISKKMFAFIENQHFCFLFQRATVKVLITHFRSCHTF